MVHHIVQLLNENVTLGLAKVGMIVATELIVAEDEVPNLVHHPLDLVLGAHAVGVAVEDGKRHVADPVERNLCLYAL